MIHHLNPKRGYTNRTYLTQWFLEDTLVITDNDFENCAETLDLLSAHPLKNRVVDVTHNPYPDSKIPTSSVPVLTNNFEFWRRPKTDVYFFPIFLWMFSLRSNLWWPVLNTEAGLNKTQGIMCLNNNSRPHRTWLWEEFTKRNLTDHMMYTFVGHRTLPDEPLGSTRIDVGVGHWVYNQYAVNLVTETDINLLWLSEKTCKPFIARQIPILVGSAGINQFLTDVGLDMFADVVPWTAWDSKTDSAIRLQKIVDFVESWICSGSILADYNRLLGRVEANKRYFHSETFRNRIMNQMSNLIPA